MPSATPTAPFDSQRAAWLACALLVGCGGTPTADPPDFLRRPMGIGVGAVEVTATGVGVQSFGPIPIVGGVDSVDPSADVWIVNLDRTEVAPQIISPEADGSFAGSVEGDVGDRFRLLSRTADRHSLPVDLEAVRGLSMTALAPLQEEGLTCLRITPTGELDLGTESSRKASFALDNRCANDVQITSATLRFADTQLALVAPMNVGAGDKAELELTLTGTLSEELWEIVLLEVSSGALRGRYALSVWAR